MLDKGKAHVLTYARVTPEGSGILVALNMSAGSQAVNLNSAAAGFAASPLATLLSSPGEIGASSPGTRITLPPVRRPGWRRSSRRRRGAAGEDAANGVTPEHRGRCGHARLRAAGYGPMRPAPAYVLAHGAGAGMEQPFLQAAATELARARHRYPALPVSLYRARFQTPSGSAAPLSRDGARRGGRGAASGARDCRSLRAGALSAAA